MAARGKVIVAGGGALGLSCALLLADAGFEVSVHDPAPAGDNASGVAAGMLAPVLEAALDPAARPHFDLLWEALHYWPAFADWAGIALDRTGALAVGQESWIVGVARAISGLSARARPVGPLVLEGAAPGIAPGLQGLLVSTDWRLDAPLALSALREAGKAAGVSFHQSLAPEAPGDALLVVATGASQSLAAVAPELAALSPIKGHILRAPGRLKQVLRGDGVYAAPTAGGVLIGATMEPGLDDRVVDAGQVDALRAAGARLLPELADAPVEAFVGVRAASPDGLPLAGRSATPGVLIAAGARRNGWLLAPLVAQTVADCAIGREPGPWAARLAPGRFSPPG